MTIEFSTNMSPGTAPADYQISLSLNYITIVVADAASSSGILMTAAGDFLSTDSTATRNGELKFSIHKADAVTLVALSRLNLLGNFKLEVKKVMHRKEEIQEFLINVIPG